MSISYQSIVDQMILNAVPRSTASTIDPAVATAQEVMGVRQHIQQQLRERPFLRNFHEDDEIPIRYRDYINNASSFWQVGMAPTPEGIDSSYGRRIDGYFAPRVTTDKPAILTPFKDHEYYEELIENLTLQYEEDIDDLKSRVEKLEDTVDALLKALGKQAGTYDG